MFLTGTRISLVVCRALVENYHKGQRTTALELANRYNINVRILNVSFRRLVKGGVLISQTGGTSPGYIFARHPKEISIYEVLEILEGKQVMDCCKQVILGMKCDVEDCSNCLLYGKINQMLRELSSNLKGISVYDHYLSCKNTKEDGLSL